VFHERRDGDMGFLNLEDTQHWRVIKARLSRRGLKPVLDADDKGRTEWEIHGPHRDMDYQVYIGLAYEDDPGDSFYVVMYPRAVYELGDSDWLSPEPENRIPVTK